MRFVVKKEDLYNGIKIVERATSMKALQPVLLNILIETIDNATIKLVATDLDLTVIAYVNAQVEEEGKITFLHKVKNGAIDKSYGINVASLAKLPKDLIKRSEEILDIYEHKSIKKEVFTQTSLFENNEEEVEKIEQENEIEEKIKEINPLEMTPIEALSFLYDLKKMIDEDI